jgi:O-antigen/teichoic acid export membrane protein
MNSELPASSSSCSGAPQNHEGPIFESIGTYPVPIPRPEASFSEPTPNPKGVKLTEVGLRTIRTLIGRTKSLAMNSGVGGPASALTVAQAAVLLAALIVNIAAARAMGPEGRGQLALHLQICYFLSAGLVLGRDQALLVVVHHGPSGPRHVLISRLLRLPVLATIGLSALVALWFSPDARTFVAFVASYMLMVGGSLYFRMTRMAAILSNTTWTFALATGICQFFFTGAAMVLLFYSYSEPILWLAAYGITTALPVFTWHWRQVRTQWQPYTLGNLEPTIRRLGFRLAPSALMEIFLLRLDRLILPAVGTYGDLGIYVVASTFTELTLVFLRQYIDARIPIWTRDSVAGRLARTRILVTTAALTSGLSAIVALVSYVCIPVLFGQQYRAAIDLLPALALAAALYGWSRVGAALAAVRRATLQVWLINASGAVIGAAAYLLLIPKLGALGAAYGSAIGYGVCAAVAMLCVISHRKERVG